MTTTFTRGENPLRADKLNTALDERVARSGDEMSGPLLLSRDPVDPFESATKQYVDTRVDAIHIGSAVSGQTILTDDSTGVLIPGYVYPNNPYSDATFQALLQLIRKFHDVPVIYAINPASGPGTVWDGNYAAAIRLLRAAGAAVIGYVSTVYATRPVDAVQNDVLKWGELYADTPIDGIFFDEMPWDVGSGNSNIILYQSYYQFVKEQGYNIIVGNPGTNQQGAWYEADPPTADIIVTWENSVYPSEVDMAGNFIGGHTDYSWKRNSVMVHSQPFDETAFTMMKKYVKWLWATDDLLVPNPWDTFPSYMSLIFAACRSRSYARMQMEWPVGSGVSNGTVYFTYDAPYDGTITRMKHFCNTGSFTVAIQINGVSVTGLGAVTPTGTPTTTNATAVRTFTVGQRISAVITGATGSPTDALLSLNVTWT